jgi:hypothetical protein
MSSAKGNSLIFLAGALEMYASHDRETTLQIIAPTATFILTSVMLIVEGLPGQHPDRNILLRSVNMPRPRTTCDLS